MVRTHEIDVTQGNLLKNIIKFALPIIGINILQILFTTTDTIVLGVFTNDYAVAGVGATSNIINLLVGFFVAFSTGVNVLIARCKGSKDQQKARKAVGSAILLSIIGGIVFCVVGVILAEDLLIMTKCAPTVLPYATKYLRIYFLGMPIIMLYNFSAAILRSVGDTFRPLFFLIIAGVVNVGLNIFFVLVVGWDVEGVAIATVASKCISAVSSLILIIKNDGYAKLERKYFRFNIDELKEILIIGLPIGISKCLFSVANIIFQTTLNALGDVAMTAQSVTKEFDGIILEVVHGVGIASLSIISQNYGAKKYGRIKKAIFVSIGINLTISLILGTILIIFGRTLCGIISDTPEVLELCMVRITTVSIFYTVLGILNVLQESIRGLGKSFIATMISIFANIILRLIYLFGFYPWLSEGVTLKQNFALVSFTFPMSWTIATVASLFILVGIYKKQVKQLNQNQDFTNEQNADRQSA
ncbi:MAG: MATE family efflux transporter [Clostridia bacterium]|nr:MATE family efflux transporter [Clostridia bacterium]